MGFFRKNATTPTSAPNGGAAVTEPRVVEPISDADVHDARVLLDAIIDGFIEHDRTGSTAVASDAMLALSKRAGTSDIFDVMRRSPGIPMHPSETGRTFYWLAAVAEHATACGDGETAARAWWFTWHFVHNLHLTVFDNLPAQRSVGIYTVPMDRVEAIAAAVHGYVSKLPPGEAIFSLHCPTPVTAAFLRQTAECYNDSLATSD
jgi:hypothetical protein